MTPPSGYSYRSSTKSQVSDELLNTYLLRPIAGLVVRVLYPTPVTPNQVTIAGICAGLASAWCYFQGSATFVLAAGILLTTKDLLDTADGQLARARNIVDRKGRFLDSIGDFVVNVAVFAAIGWTLRATIPATVSFFLAFAACLGLTLRVSYHVFYQTSFLHLGGSYKTNRVSEEMGEDDRSADATTRRLQRTYLAIYGWQDRMMEGIDRWSQRGVSVDQEAWYGSRTALRLSGMIGLGTELFLLMVCSIFNVLGWYMVMNLLIMNGIGGACIMYRRGLARRLQRRDNASGTFAGDR